MSCDGVLAVVPHQWCLRHCWVAQGQVVGLLRALQNGTKSLPLPAPPPQWQQKLQTLLEIESPNRGDSCCGRCIRVPVTAFVWAPKAGGHVVVHQCVSYPEHTPQEHRAVHAIHWEPLHLPSWSLVPSDQAAGTRPCRGSRTPRTNPMKLVTAVHNSSGATLSTAKL